MQSVANVLAIAATCIAYQTPISVTFEPVLGCIGIQGRPPRIRSLFLPRREPLSIGLATLDHLIITVQDRLLTGSQVKESRKQKSRTCTWRRKSFTLSKSSYNTLWERPLYLELATGFNDVVVD